MRSFLRVSAVELQRSKVLVPPLNRGETKCQPRGLKRVLITVRKTDLGGGKRENLILRPIKSRAEYRKNYQQRELVYATVCRRFETHERGAQGGSVRNVCRK